MRRKKEQETVYDEPVLTTEKSCDCGNELTNVDIEEFDGVCEECREFMNNSFYEHRHPDDWKIA